MAKKGWVSIHRKLLDHWLWEEPRRFSRAEAWIDLILGANHADAKVLFNDALLIIPRGSLVTSRIKLAQKWGWHRETVEAFFRLLISDNMIRCETSNSKTHIFIINYDSYQDLDNEQPTTLPSPPPAPKRQRHQQRSGNGTSLNNNENNDNNENKNTGELNPAPFPEGFDTPENRAALDEWVRYRKQIKKPLASLSVQKLLTHWASKPEQFQNSVSQSIEKGWTGLFEPREESANSPPGRPVAGGPSPGLRSINPNSTAERVNRNLEFTQSLDDDDTQRNFSATHDVLHLLPQPIRERNRY